MLHVPTPKTTTTASVVRHGRETMTQEELGQLLSRLEIALTRRPLPAIVEINAADVMKMVGYLRDNGVKVYSRPVEAIKTRVVKRGGMTYREEV